MTDSIYRVVRLRPIGKTIHPRTDLAQKTDCTRVEETLNVRNTDAEQQQ